MKRKNNDPDACLLCGQSTQLPRRGARGLCDVHYRRFLKKLKSLKSDDAQSAFDEKCVARGILLEKKSGGPKKMDEDPFDEIFAETAAEYEVSESKAVADAIQEAKDLTKKAIAKRKANRKKPGSDSGAA